MTASKRRRKLQTHVAKGHKHEEEQEHEDEDEENQESETERELQESELVLPVQNEGPSSNGAAPVEVEKDGGGPVDGSVLQTFRDHIAYSIWKGEEYAGVNDAHALLHRVLFGGDTQAHDMTLVANRVYDILSSAKTVEKEIEQEHRTSERREFFPQTTSTPTIATAPPSISAMATATVTPSTLRTAPSKTREK
ncbi:hypothetical protein LguiB_012484 [Lonicera macranthoides]